MTTSEHLRSVCEDLCPTGARAVVEAQLAEVQEAYAKTQSRLALVDAEAAALREQLFMLSGAAQALERLMTDLGDAPGHGPQREPDAQVPGN